MKTRALIAGLLSVLLVPAVSQAISITLTHEVPVGGSGKTNTFSGTLDSALSGAIYTGAGTPSSADITSAVDCDDWVDIGHVDPGNGLTDGFLTVAFNNGGFGQADADGTWSIDPAFLSSYANLAISIHVGGWAYIWQVDLSDGLSGTWDVSLDVGNGGGGGFSNMVAWGCDEPHRTPDGAATLMLLGLAMASIGMFRKVRPSVG